MKKSIATDSSATPEEKQPSTRIEFSRQMLNSAQAREFLGITMMELKSLRKCRRISFYRIGHRTVTYDVADLEAFLQTCFFPSQPAVLGRAKGA